MSEHYASLMECETRLLAALKTLEAVRDVLKRRQWFVALDGEGHAFAWRVGVQELEAEARSRYPLTKFWVKVWPDMPLHGNPDRLLDPVEVLLKTDEHVRQLEASEHLKRNRMEVAATNLARDFSLDEQFEIAAMARNVTVKRKET